MSMKTPVAFIVFNRPSLTSRVFEAIRQAQPSKLFVIADGPRADHPKDVENCMAVNNIVEQVDWPCEVIRDYAEHNLGCKYRVSSGLNRVFMEAEEAIVLEDDCLPHSSFFPYCEELLNRYRNDRRIGIISGHNELFGYRRSSHSYYYSNIPHVWGWATWRRNWELYDCEMKAWPEVREHRWLKDIFINNIEVKSWESIFECQYDGCFDTWDYQLIFASLVNSWLNITPNVNLISNLGFGADATRTKSPRDRLAEQSIEEMIFPLQHPPFFINDMRSEYKTFKGSATANSPFTLRWERKIKKFWRDYQNSRP